MTHIKYKEKDIHEFLVVKKIKPDDNSEYWIMEGPDGRRLLLEASHYEKYGICEGIVVKCRIDKVNCSGKIFLEPLSDLKDGEVYEFPVRRVEKQRDPIGKIRTFYIVETPLGLSYCEVNSRFSETPRNLHCRIRRIKKGHAWLELAENPVIACRQGTVEDMLVLSSCHFHEGVRCYLLKDSYGNGHILAFEPYSRFGLKTGVWSDFYVVSIKLDESCVVEPKHPVYKEGDYAVFSVKGTAMRESQGYNDGKVLQLEGEKGFEGIAFVSEQDEWKYPKGSKIKGKILKFKKGVPLISTEDAEIG